MTGRSRSIGRPTSRVLAVADAAEAGARRISVGGGLTWVAGGALLEAATELRDHGTLGAFARSPGMRGIVPLLAD